MRSMPVSSQLYQSVETKIYDPPAHFHLVQVIVPPSFSLPCYFLEHPPREFGNTVQNPLNKIYTRPSLRTISVEDCTAPIFPLSLEIDLTAS